MPDILSQGGDPRSSRWPRRLALAAALLLVTAVVVEHQPWAGHTGARPASVVIAGTGTAVGAPGLAHEPDGITGQVLPWPAGVAVPAAEQRPAWFWPSTGQTRPIGGLARQRSGYQFTQVVGGWAVQPVPAAQPGCPECAGPPRPVYFLGYGAPSVTWAGTADAVAPGTAPGELWLTSYPSDAPPWSVAGRAQEVSAAGRPLGPAVRLPVGYMIDQATDRGLLLAPVAQRPAPGAYWLWDPAAPSRGRVFPGVVAAGPGQIAWVAACAARCRVNVLDLGTGRQVTATLPEGSSVANAAFSPDGSLLALQVGFLDNDDDGALAMRLELLAAASGRLSVVPDTLVSSDALDGFGWPTDGDTLVAELSFTAKVQLASWVTGARWPAVAVLVRSPATLAIGQYIP